MVDEVAPAQKFASQREIRHIYLFTTDLITTNLFTTNLFTTNLITTKLILTHRGLILLLTHAHPGLAAPYL